MRRSRGVLLPPVSAERIRRRDLYQALRSALMDGVLTPGERLPSSRQAGADYGVSRGLVEEVYAQLTEEGFLDRAVGRGSFVSERVARLVPTAQRNGKPRHSPTLSPRGMTMVTNSTCREPEVARPFNAGIADTSEFPWNTWQRLQARAVRELGPAALRFADPRGLPALRSAIARYLAQFRGFRCTERQVVVFGSAQQALFALALLLIERGDRVWVEDPGYPGARAALELAGADIASVPVDEQGLCVAAGIRDAPRARLAYVTPPHQYPTGAALAPERRAALLDWAERRDAWVIEDDYDGEFRYAGQPLAPLAALDASTRVIYVGTLSKAMFVSLRIAFAVLPEPLVESLATLRTQLDGFTPPLAQKAMSLFLDEGHFPTHVRRMRALYGAKRAALVEGLAPLVSRGWTWSANPAGLHLLMRHRDGALARRIASRSSLDLALLGTYRTRRGRDDGLFLRFGSLDTSALRDGIDVLVTELKRGSA